MVDRKGFGRLIEEFSSYEKRPKRSKHNRTLSLDTEYFLKLQEFCKERGVPVSEILNRLMQEFLESLAFYTPPHPDEATANGNGSANGNGVDHSEVGEEDEHHDVADESGGTFGPMPPQKKSA